MIEKSIRVVADLRSQRFFGACLNVVSMAAALAGKTGVSVEALIVGPPESACVAFDEAASECAAHGADVVTRITASAPLEGRADLFALALARFVEARGAALMLFPLNDFMRETAARLAVARNAGLVADCEALSLLDGRFVADCPSWGGRIMARIGFADGQQEGYVTVNPTAFERMEGKSSAFVQVEIFYAGALSATPGLRLLASRPEKREKGGLSDAEIVVAGGAGMGSPEGFSRLRELAAALSGQLGATRPPVLNHWIDEERLIGQTGKSVAPKLLISVGTSGAVQYTAGIAEAQSVVAVNRDKSAPIFETADVGVVADAVSFVSVLAAKVKTATLKRLAENVCEPDTAEPGAAGGPGRIVEKLRTARNWSLADLAQATGQTPEFLAQVEKDEVTPPVSFLLRLARALDVDPSAFLGSEAMGRMEDEREKAYTRRTENYSYETLTPGAEKEHLRAFLITIEPKKAHKPVDYKHEGEEFVYVLEGELELTLAGKPLVLKPFESRHFNSLTPHKLRSLSDSVTRCLVMLYTP